MPADALGRRGEKERVAVRLRLRDRLRREIAAGAWTVLDDELLAEMFRQPLADQAGISVVDAAGRKAGQDPRRMGRIVLRIGIAQTG
jgi:hypothetical protein